MLKQLKALYNGFMIGFRAAQNNEFEQSIVNSQVYSLEEMFKVRELALMDQYLQKNFGRDLNSLTSNITFRRHLATENGYGGLYLPRRKVISISDTCFSFMVGKIDTTSRAAYLIHELTHVIQNDRRGIKAKYQMLKTLLANIMFAGGDQNAYFEDKNEKEAFDHQAKFMYFVRKYDDLSDEIARHEENIEEWIAKYGETDDYVLCLQDEIDSCKAKLHELLN